MEINQEILEARKNILEKAKLAKQASQVQTLPKEKFSDKNLTADATKAKIIIKVLPNSLEATLLLHPSSPHTDPPTKEELLSALSENNIVYGINMELIEDLCVKPVYYHVFVIARGVPAQTGQNGYLNYLVSNTADRSPVIGEDGIADYKNINFFRVVQKGQPLCEVYFAQKGEDGIDIHGNVIEGQYGEDAFDPQGKNTEYNEDKTLLCAAIDGHVTVQYGKINVIEVLRIDTNVNNSTGNINFTGDVIVGGDVSSGFSIKCGGSIVVHGSVEGAVLEAGTDINVSAGMLGMDKGSVNAGGDIKCKFIQNCTVRATGDIYADSILFSNVECNGDLVLSGKKGALIGGTAAVAGKVMARTIGSPLNAQTEIQMVSLDKQTNQLINALELKIKGFNTEIQEIIRSLLRFEDEEDKTNPQLTKELIQATDRYRECLTQREVCERQLGDLREKQIADSEDECFVKCTGKIYTNSSVSFGKLKLNVEDTISNSKIKLAPDGIITERLTY